MIMTIVWLLLLLLAISSQSVDSQSTTDDETCSGETCSDDEELLSKILDNQQKIFQILQRHQTILSRLGKSTFP